MKMIRKFINKFGSVLYVQIWENRIQVTDKKTSVVFNEKPLLECEKLKNGQLKVTAFGNKANNTGLNPFSHPRVLLSDFIVGEKLLQEIIRQIIGDGLFVPTPAIIIHPMEKTEGGLTDVEIRAFKEMALGAGAREVVVYQGAALNITSIDFDELSRKFMGQ